MSGATGSPRGKAAQAAALERLDNDRGRNQAEINSLRVYLDASPCHACPKCRTREGRIQCMYKSLHKPFKETKHLKAAKPSFIIRKKRNNVQGIKSLNSTQDRIQILYPLACSCSRSLLPPLARRRTHPATYPTGCGGPPHPRRLWHRRSESQSARPPPPRAPPPTRASPRPAGLRSRHS